MLRKSKTYNQRQESLTKSKIASNEISLFFIYEKT